MLPCGGRGELYGIYDLPTRAASTCAPRPRVPRWLARRGVSLPYAVASRRHSPAGDAPSRHASQTKPSTSDLILAIGRFGRSREESERLPRNASRTGYRTHWDNALTRVLEQGMPAERIAAWHARSPRTSSCSRVMEKACLAYTNLGTTCSRSWRSPAAPCSSFTGRQLLRRVAQATAHTARRLASQRES